MRVYAPAKINWTLEVLGRRDDGYHEVRSVMQTVEPCDSLDFSPGDEVVFEVEGAQEAAEYDLVLKAAGILGGRDDGARIMLGKRIPSAAGLGGGSSDAAATLRGLNQVWGLDYGRPRLEELGGRIGSDVPFFIAGGTALAEERGDQITSLPEPPAVWLVLVVPPMRLPEKTKRMYGRLRREDFGDGSRTETLRQAIQDGKPINDGLLFNAFERVAYETFDGLEVYREALVAAGARRAHLAGSGPALFALAASEEEALAVEKRLQLSDGEAFVVRTLTSAEALRSEE